MQSQQPEALNSSWHGKISQKKDKNNMRWNHPKLGQHRPTYNTHCINTKLVRTPPHFVQRLLHLGIYVQHVLMSMADTIIQLGQHAIMPGHLSPIPFASSCKSWMPSPISSRSASNSWSRSWICWSWTCCESVSAGPDGPEVHCLLPEFWSIFERGCQGMGWVHQHVSQNELHITNM